MDDCAIEAHEILLLDTSRTYNELEFYLYGYNLKSKLAYFLQ